jgi:hypothetical protein
VKGKVRVIEEQYDVRWDGTDRNRPGEIGSELMVGLRRKVGQQLCLLTSRTPGWGADRIWG